MNFEYGGHYKDFPITTTAKEKRTGSFYAVHNIFDEIPIPLTYADMVIVDPPWNLGNLNSFYTKADRDDRQNDFSKFLDRLFWYIDGIEPNKCFIEMGNQAAKDCKERVGSLFNHVQVVECLYYNKNPTNFVIGTRKKSQNYRALYTGTDEACIIRNLCSTEDYDCVADMCFGLGLVPLWAFKAGKRFAGCELNHKRAAHTLQRIAKAGGIIQIV